MSDQPKDNVVNIEAGKKSQGKKKKADKLSLVDVYDQIMLAINQSVTAVLPKFPVKFYVVEPEPGIKLIVEELPGETVRYVHEDRMVDVILQYSIKIRTKWPDLAITHRHAKEAMGYWRNATHAIPTPPMSLEKSTPGLTFHRLPFDIPRTGSADWDRECPLFGEISTRMTNWDAFAAWIGSLLIPGADRQQYVWVYGQGQDGKGSLARILHRIFGPAYCSINHIPDDKNRFWLAQLINKRLVVFPDCNHFGFPVSGLFKTLTGNDPVSIERKFKDPYTTMLDAKFIFFSNEKPALSSEKSDLRRVIYAGMQPFAGEPEPHYEEKLWSEVPMFLAYCLETYKRLVPRGGIIKTDKEEIDAIVAANEERLETWFNKYFRPVEVPPNCKEEDMPFVCSERMQQAFDDGRFLYKQHRDIRSWMERKKGVVHKRVRLSDQSKPYRYLKVEVLPQAAAEAQNFSKTNEWSQKYEQY